MLAKSPTHPPYALAKYVLARARNARVSEERVKLKRVRDEYNIIRACEFERARARMSMSVHVRAYLHCILHC